MTDQWDGPLTRVRQTVAKLTLGAMLEWGERGSHSPKTRSREGHEDYHFIFEAGRCFSQLE
jgi:hypothetical protein